VVDDPGSAFEPSLELSIQQVAVRESGSGSYEVILRTNRGDLSAALNACEGGTGAAVFVGGASGGIDGPAGGVYSSLAPALSEGGVTSLRIDYRQPGEFDECVLDALGGISFLRGIGAERIVLIGHSFGGAVVIKAGELAHDVSGVVAMSSQLFGTADVARLTPKPLLLVHGMDDQVLEATASQIIYDRAEEPKELVLYPGAGHSLLQCRDELFALLSGWIVRHAAEPSAEA
jgi:alpha-beta hydrolase superfamily lysophospholipase